VDEELDQLRAKAADLYEELKPRLRRMVEGRIPSRLHGRIDVDGVLQDGWVRLRASLGNKRPASDTELRAWIFKKVWSQWLDEQRKHTDKGRNAFIEQPIPDGSVEALLEGIGIATNLVLKETVERIREVVKPLDFEIVWMHIVDEFSFVGIAEMAGMTQDAVRKRYIRALEKIQAAVGSPFNSSS